MDPQTPGISLSFLSFGSAIFIQKLKLIPNQWNLSNLSRMPRVFAVLEFWIMQKMNIGFAHTIQWLYYRWMLRKRTMDCGLKCSFLPLSNHTLICPKFSFLLFFEHISSRSLFPFGIFGQRGSASRKARRFPRVKKRSQSENAFQTPTANSVVAPCFTRTLKKTVVTHLNLVSHWSGIQSTPP